ncbi:unnamed protein product [marine sediment metagenome]|uniref:Uncharacterized protein n=1 Tax=marine sediment metagenome TaxID=412755 RepID=X1LZH8_9ZZZZ
MFDVKDMTTLKADEIADQRYGREFYDLPKDQQFKVWHEAEAFVRDQIATEADALVDAIKEGARPIAKLFRRSGK